MRSLYRTEIKLGEMPPKEDSIAYKQYHLQAVDEMAIVAARAWNGGEGVDSDGVVYSERTATNELLKRNDRLFDEICSQRSGICAFREDCHIDFNKRQDQRFMKMPQKESLFERHGALEYGDIKCEFLEDFSYTIDDIYRIQNEKATEKETNIDSISDFVGATALSGVIDNDVEEYVIDSQELAELFEYYDDNDMPF